MRIFLLASPRTQPHSLGRSFRLWGWFRRSSLPFLLLPLWSPSLPPPPPALSPAPLASSLSSSPPSSSPLLPARLVSIGTLALLFLLLRLLLPTVAWQCSCFAPHPQPPIFYLLHFSNQTALLGSHCTAPLTEPFLTILVTLLSVFSEPRLCNFVNKNDYRPRNFNQHQCSRCHMFFPFLLSELHLSGYQHAVPVQQVQQ